MRRSPSVWKSGSAAPDDAQIDTQDPQTDDYFDALQGVASLRTGKKIFPQRHQHYGENNHRQRQPLNERQALAAEPSTEEHRDHRIT